MALPSRRTPARALTASARKLTAAESAYTRRLSWPWQLRALGYYDTIGEINFTAKYLGRQFSRVRFMPGRIKEDQTVEPIESGPALELLDQIQDPGGGRTQLQFDFARLSFLTGEGVLFGYEGGTKWKYLWKDEVKRLESGQYVRLDWQKQPTDEIGEGYRFWTTHPRHSDEADCPMRAVMDICEELLILTLSVRSTALTRMTKGILGIPQEISPNPLSVGLDEDPEQNILLSDLIEHTGSQIENPGSVEASVPFVLEAPAEYLKEVVWIKTHDPATDYMEKDLRTEAIKRLALSLDMSPEDLLGYTDSNHWTARAVQLDRWRMFGFPKAQEFANGLADAYLRPALEAEGEDASNIVVTFDDSQVVISPDRTEDALKAHAQGIINGKAARTALGWNDEDALEGEEKDEFFALKLREPALLEDGAIVLPARGPLPSQNGGDPRDGPPPPGTNTGVSRQESRTASIYGAAALALHRCRELAGIRIRHKCTDCAEGHENAVVAAALGPDAIGEPIRLVQGGADGFRSLLAEWGLTEALSASLAQTLEVYAARTLCQERLPELPPGFIAQVEKAREVSHALVDSAS